MIDTVSASSLPNRQEEIKLDFDFLKRVYMASIIAGPHKEASKNLCGLFERIEETTAAGEAIEAALTAAGLDLRQQESLSYPLALYGDAYGMEGFINGFHLGMKLAKELQL